MDKRYKELLKNIGLLSISNFATKVLIFFLVPLYTSVLSNQDYGIYDISYTTIELFFPIFTVCMFEGVLRFCLESKNDKKKIISIGFIYWGVSNILFALVINLCTTLHIFQQMKQYVMSIIIFYASYTLYQLMINVAKGLNNVKAMAMGGVISTICVVASNVLFLLFFRSGLRGFYCANILGQLIPAIYLCNTLKVFSRISFKIDRKTHKEMRKYSSPLILNTIGWWMNANIDKYIVIWICGVATNGLLGVAYKIPNIIAVTSGIFKQAWQISAVKTKDNEDKDTFYRENYIIFNAIIGFLISVLIIGSPFIGKVMFQKEFVTAWRYVPFLLCASMFNQGAGYIGPILQAEMNSGSIAKSAVYGMLSNVVLNIIFVKTMGPIGVTIATAISSYIIFLIRDRDMGTLFRWRKRFLISFLWGSNIVLACIVEQTVFSKVEIFILVTQIFIFRKTVAKFIKYIGKMRRGVK